MIDTISKEVHFAVDVVDGIDNIAWPLPIRLPRFQLTSGTRGIEEFVPAIEVHPRRSLFKAFAYRRDFGRTDVGEGGDGVAVQRGESDLVEVDEADLGDAGADEGGDGVGSDTAAADYDNEG